MHFGGPAARPLQIRNKMAEYTLCTKALFFIQNPGRENVHLQGCELQTIIQDKPKQCTASTPHLPPPVCPAYSCLLLWFSGNRWGGEVKVKDRWTETDREDRVSQREQVSHRAATMKIKRGNTQTLCWEKKNSSHSLTDDRCFEKN